MKELLYDVKANWDLLKPFLKDEDVKEVLHIEMESYCDQRNELWEEEKGPWFYTKSSYWADKIMDKINDSEEHQKEWIELEHTWLKKLHGANVDLADENLIDDLQDNDEFLEAQGVLYEKYFDKFSPEKDSFEWYQLIHGCHWINAFLGKLISKAFDIPVDIWSTEKHTVAIFTMNDIIYYADMNDSWENVDEMLEYIEAEDVEYYTIEN